MPTYEYECRACGHRFSIFQNMNDKPIEACPECASEVRRLISGGSGIVFKGSGFHATDYKKTDACCGQDSGCDNPKRCCGK